MTNPIMSWIDYQISSFLFQVKLLLFSFCCYYLSSQPFLCICALRDSAVCSPYLRVCVCVRALCVFFLAFPLFKCVCVFSVFSALRSLYFRLCVFHMFCRFFSERQCFTARFLRWELRLREATDDVSLWRLTVVRGRPRLRRGCSHLPVWSRRKCAWPRVCVCPQRLSFISGKSTSGLYWVEFRNGMEIRLPIFSIIIKNNAKVHKYIYIKPGSSYCSEFQSFWTRPTRWHSCVCFVCVCGTTELMVLSHSLWVCVLSLALHRLTDAHHRPS